MDELWHKWRWRHVEEEAWEDEEVWAEWVSIYRPLEESEIRLLRLDPAQSQEAPLKCRLLRVALPIAPPYIALSYHWGDSNHTADVEVNKTSLPVTVNLKAALLRLRAEGVDTVWADALCINQKDNKEKSLQIPRIDAIFRKASEVAIWTGDELDIDEAASQSLSTNTPLELGENTCLSTLPFFNNLLARPYWGRVWIIQELAVALNISLYCGRFRIPWRAIDITCACCRNIVNDRGHPADTNVFRFEMLRRVRTNSLTRQPISLLDALHQTMSSLATDPRDKIFALLGLTYDWKHFVPEPSYVDSKSDIFTSFAIALLMGDEPLDIIYLKSAKRKVDQDMPSWVPDWTDLNDLVAHRQFDYILDRRSNPARPVRRFKEAKTEISSRVLSTRGILYDVVDALGSSLTINGEATFAHETSKIDHSANPYELDIIPSIVYQTLVSTYLFSSVSHKNFGDIPEGFHRLWEIESTQQLAEAYPTFISQNLANSICTWLTENRSFVVHGQTIESWTKTRIQSQNEKNKPVPNEPQFFNAIRSRMRLLMTEGGYLGWAHPQARKGDKIAILVGCSRPVVLRTCQGGYRIVGDAFLSGISISSLCETAAAEVQMIRIL